MINIENMHPQVVEYHLIRNIVERLPELTFTRRTGAAPYEFSIAGVHITVVWDIVGRDGYKVHLKERDGATTVRIHDFTLYRLIEYLDKQAKAEYRNEGAKELLKTFTEYSEEPAKRKKKQEAVNDNCYSATELGLKEHK